MSKHPCEGCRFAFAGYGVDLYGCEYFLITGQRRPCPAGKGCTVKRKAQTTKHEQQKARLNGIARESRRKE